MSLLLLFGCHKNSDNVVTPPPPSTGGTHVVTAAGTSFSPNTLSVKVGDTIKFVWSQGNHTTTSTTIPSGAAAWDQPLNSSSTTYLYIIHVAGTYNYQCTFHVAMGMTGSFTAN